MDVENTIREYIEPLYHMSLATVSDVGPWVCEVHFAYDENLNLYFRSKPSRRHSQEIAINSRVAGNIVRTHALGEVPMGVYFEGTAAMLSDGPELEQAFECIDERMKPPGDIKAEAREEDGHKFYKIVVENWYVFGRGDDGVKKYQLEWDGGTN